MTSLAEHATDHSTAHLTPQAWAAADRHLVAKALAEFAHERLLAPRPLGGDRYVVRSDDGRTEYHFAARRRALDHWSVDPASIVALRGADIDAPDALRFVLDLRSTLGLSDAVLPVYLEELSSTLARRAFQASRPQPTAEELVDADFQAVEAAMTEGHPCFVANNGRLGFDAAEYRAYAPEAAEPVRLTWLAVRRDRSRWSSSAGLAEQEFHAAQLDAGTLARFDQRLRALELDPADYRLLPVHPWQWTNRVAVTFAAALAHRDLVELGEGDDEHRAQQSIRTLFNVSDPHRDYVKTALSVLNMGFVRGLSAEYMAVTPAINDWVHELVSGDEVLAARGFSVLRERAAVGYTDRWYTDATVPGSPYRKMLAALWRESPVPTLRPGQRLATMASLLHVDAAGRPFVSALVARSGLAPAQWLRRYLEAYLVPVLHCYYAHDLVFMPHGENLVLVLEDGVPVRVVMKDIGEEVVLMHPDTPLPAEVERIRADVPEELRLLSVQTDVFDCFLRFLSALLDEDGVLGEHEFWATVAACVRDHQAEVPELAGAFARGDLFAPTFALSCLNRLQLRDNRQMVDLADPAGGLQFAGELVNPLAAHR
ncbi:IucA/IucC family siderophore biosynthesis protein [Modestobacter sp. I12A-02628]|uniref:IucA/IucC family siderophore biosynthesis protein n=1 Tax=Goekera deserti TaxID=2497753 RepID=A0A7K3WBQ2_9ACTN|nr:IucA/IucC family siderophore biosynthesis protein [Goekera deserti]MPQ98229.1 IucA/IucC family siderophore biosynthesis protein [Goekera deserti]NDI48055.1 IucA/IucC family siderophore biosynthesis protein [Goekera deserti]NEL53804.1 IucA/IucC family siderophore biosynthesis protein [Goekera deserti]